MQDGPPADPEAVARAIVLRRLTLAPRTRAELAKTLAERRVPEPAALAVLDRFTELGLINDVQFARSFTESRREGWSRRAIAAKLRDRGVPRDVVEDALLPVSGDDESRTALELARRRWPRLRELDQVTRQRRLAGVLARRGYASAVVRAVIAEVERAGESSSSA